MSNKEISKQADNHTALKQNTPHEITVNRVQATIENRGPCPKYKSGSEDQPPEPDLKRELAIEGEITRQEHKAALMTTYGLDREGAVDWLLSLQATAAGGDQDLRELNGSLALIEELRPKGPIESMLASQMTATHSAVMKMERKLKEGMSLELFNAFSRHHDKLQTTFVKQALAFNKIRTGGKQTVIVKKVHVHEGAQAVIGNVGTNEAGG